MSERDIAVVLPCYGQAHFLPEALESVRAQTLAPAEIVVVDDGSPDDVAGAAAGFENVRVVRQENRGLSGARNRGLAETTAPFVLFLDSDDTLRPHALETLRAWMTDHPDAALAWGFNQPWHDDGRALEWGPTTFEGVADYAALLEENVVGAPLGVLFRRTPLEAVGGFAEDMPACEDREIYLRIARSHPIGCVGALVADYRHHGSNMSRNHELMHASAREALRRQEPWVRGDARLEAALARGLRLVDRRWGYPAAVSRMKRAIDEGRWGQAAGEAIRIATRFPGPLIRALGGRFRRT
jgi:glycosyltransferase involved in cell wall biosynthesis